MKRQIELILLSLLGSALHYAAIGGVRQSLLAIPVIYIGLVILYIFVLCAVSLFADKEVPLKRQSGLCRRMCADIACTALGLSLVVPRISGEELLPQDGNFVFVCNHRSGYDPLIVLDKLRKYNISFISKPSNIAIPVLGRIALGAGFLPIDRKNDREAMKTIHTAVDYLCRGVCSVGIYPEGTRTKTGELLPFHPGSFKLPQRAKVPLVVASVRGTEEIAARPLRLHRVRLDILRVIPAETVCGMGTRELSEYCREIIEKSLAEG